MTARPFRTILSVSAALFAALSACAPVGTTAPQTSNFAATAPAPAAGAGLTAALRGTESLNAFRAANGRPPLRRNAVLDRAASIQAADMARNGFFSHTGSDGSSVGDRARRSGYGFCRIAENLAVRARDVPDAVRLWEQSPGHLSTMLHRDVREYGMAVSGPYTVLVVGRSGC